MTLPGGRRRAPRRLAAAVGVLIVGGLVGLSLIGSEPEAAIFRFENRAVDGADTLIDDADRAFLRAARREDAALDDDARCYFSLLSAESRGDIEPLLRCGPVVHSGGKATAAWDTLPLRSVATGRLLRLVTEGDAETGQTLRPDERLARPDGADPPSGPLELTPPGPARLEPGVVVVASRAPDGLDLRSVATTLELPGGGELEVLEVGTADEVRIADKTRRPAHDEELVVARLRLRPPAGSSVEVVAGRRRRTVPDTEQLRSGRFVITSVPARVDGRLEVTYRGVSQSVSLRTGLASGDRTPLAGLAVVEINQEVPRQEVPLDVAGESKAVILGEFALNRASLVAHTEWLGAAPPGQGWLSLAISGFIAPSVLGADRVSLDLASSFVAVLPDGRSVPASELGPSTAGERAVFFAVPDTVRAVVIRVAPTFAVAGDSGTATFTAPPLELAVAFGT